MICGYPKRIFGALAVVSADNLGSLALGGYRIPKTGYQFFCNL